MGKGKKSKWLRSVQSRTENKLDKIQQGIGRTYENQHKLGRNDPCHCQSGKKYKRCHLNEDQQFEAKERDKVYSPAIPQYQIDHEAKIYQNLLTTKDKSKV